LGTNSKSILNKINKIKNIKEIFQYWLIMYTIVKLFFNKNKN